jgi:glycosyltransferase involved in cell wall biosynthesis
MTEINPGTRVTWIMPVLNGMPYLEETLRGIRDCTNYPVELLVWENGSTDGTAELLAEWIPNRIPGKVFSGVKYGVGGSLRELVSRVKTEFCARIDADDIPLPGRIDAQVAFLDANPDVTVIGGQIQGINEKGQEGPIVARYPTSHEGILAMILSGHNPIGHSTVMFRTKEVIRSGNYLDLPNVEDYELWLRLAIRHHIENLPIPLTKYRVHTQSVTRIALREERLQPLVNAVLINHSHLLYGWSPENMKRFIEGRLFPILKHARSLTIPTWSADDLPPFRNPLFLELLQSRCLTRDIISLTVLALMDPRPGATLRVALRRVRRLLTTKFQKTR